MSNELLLAQVLSLMLIGQDVVGPQAEARKARAAGNATTGGSGAWSAPAGALLGPLAECLEADGET